MSSDCLKPFISGFVNPLMMDCYGSPQAWVMYVPYEDKMMNERWRQLHDRQLSLAQQGRYDLYGGLQAEMDLIERMMLKGGPPASAGNAVALGAHFTHRRKGDFAWDNRIDHRAERPLVVNNVLITEGHFWQAGELHLI